MGPSCLCSDTLSTLSQVCHTDCKGLTSYFTGQDIARGETNTSEKVGHFGYPNEVPALKHARLPLEGNHPTSSNTWDSSLPWATLLAGPKMKGLRCNFVRCEANIAIGTHSLLASCYFANNHETETVTVISLHGQKATGEHKQLFLICDDLLKCLN